eukprot:scaffold32982_cov57-Phaeocystis_antarctica.AAC.1
MVFTRRPQVGHARGQPPRRQRAYEERLRGGYTTIPGSCITVEGRVLVGRPRLKRADSADDAEGDPHQQQPSQRGSPCACGHAIRRVGRKLGAQLDLKLEGHEGGRHVDEQRAARGAAERPDREQHLLGARARLDAITIIDTGPAIRADLGHGEAEGSLEQRKLEEYCEEDSQPRQRGERVGVGVVVDDERLRCLAERGEAGAADAQEEHARRSESEQRRASEGREGAAPARVGGALEEEERRVLVRKVRLGEEREEEGEAIAARQPRREARRPW